MRETRSSGSVEGVMSNHDPYSDSFFTEAYQSWSLADEAIFNDDDFRPEAMDLYCCHLCL